MMTLMKRRILLIFPAVSTCRSLRHLLSLCPFLASGNGKRCGMQRPPPLLPPRRLRVHLGRPSGSSDRAPGNRAGRGVTANPSAGFWDRPPAPSRNAVSRVAALDSSRHSGAASQGDLAVALVWPRLGGMALGARLSLDPPSTSRQPSLWAVELLRFSPRATLFDVASGGAQFANNSAGDLDGLVLPVAEPLRISNSKEPRDQTLRMEHLISLVQVSMSTARQSMTKRIFRLTCPAHRTLLLPRSLLRGGLWRWLLGEV